jgi:hypothetical protein
MRTESILFFSLKLATYFIKLTAMQSKNALDLVSERKQELLEANKQIKESVFAEVEILSTKTKEVGKVALIIGGTLLLAYFALDFFVFRKKKSSFSIPNALNLTDNQKKLVVINQENDSFINTPIIKKVLDAMAGFLIAIARQKLIDFLTNLNHSKASNVSVTEK